MDRLNEFLGEVCSLVVALLRLLFLACAMITSGMQIILFTRTEVCNIELKGMPWRCDREKMDEHLSFIEKACLQNPDLIDYADEHPDAPSDDDDEGI